MSYKNFLKGIGLRSINIGLIGFIFAFSFLLSPKEAHAELCLGNVDPKSYIEAYLKTQQRDANVDITKLATELLGVKISENVSLSNAISTVYSSSKAAVCFQNKEYWKGLNILGETATKISLSKIATAITGYSPVTWPAAVVDTGLNILRSRINEAAINNIISNYKLALGPDWCKTGINQCHQRIVECSALSTAKEVHEPRICFDSDGYMFNNGWLIYPKSSNQRFVNPELDREKFYASAKVLYQEKRTAEHIVQQNEQAAASLINDALKKSETITPTTEKKQDGFFSNLWNKIVNLFTKNDVNTELPAQISEAVNNAILGDNDAVAKLDTENATLSEDEIKDWNVLSYDTWSIKYPKRCINASVYAEASVCLSDQDGYLDSDIDLRLLRYGIRTEEGMSTDICGNNFNECIERHTKYLGIKVITSTPKNFNEFRGFELIYSIEYQRGEYDQNRISIIEVESSTKSNNVLEIEQNNSSPYIDDIYKKILSTLKRENINQKIKSPIQTLSVSLAASQSSGNAPLNGVVLTAAVSGSAQGTINYTFYCNRSDSNTNISSDWNEKFDGIFDNPKTATCNYPTPGTYTAKVIAEQGSAQTAEARLVIKVTPPVSLSQGKITALVADQFGNPLADAKFWLVDPYGENITFSRFTNENGRLQADANDTRRGGAIPVGKYTLHIEKKSIYSGVDLGYDAVKIDIELPSSGLWLDKIILKKWPIVTGILLDKSGQPAGNKSYFASENSTGGYNPTITVRDVNEKVVDELGGWMTSNPDPKTGRFQSKPLLPGRYTLKVWIPGGWQKPDIIMATREFDVSYDKKEIDIGQIIISGITD